MRETKRISFTGITALLALALFVGPGCASIVSKSEYPVTLNSTPEGLSVRVQNEKGEGVFSGTTPTTAVLRSSDGFFSKANYSLHFTGSSDLEHVTMLSPGLDGWYMGNILFGGLIGLLLVDPATGAMYKLPESVTVSMEGAGSPLVLDDALIAKLEAMVLEPRGGGSSRMPREEFLAMIPTPPTSTVKQGKTEHLRWEVDGECLLEARVSGEKVSYTKLTPRPADEDESE